MSRARHVGRGDRREVRDCRFRLVLGGHSRSPHACRNGFLPFSNNWSHRPSYLHVNSQTLSRDCRNARELLSLSLDGELDALARLKLDRHLSDCAPCRLHGAWVEAITHALRSAPLERPSILILPRFSWRRRLLRTGIPVAALAAVTLGLGFLQGSIGGSGGATTPVTTVSGVPHQARIYYAVQPQPQPPSYADVAQTP